MTSKDRIRKRDRQDNNTSYVDAFCTLIIYIQGAESEKFQLLQNETSSNL